MKCQILPLSTIVCCHTKMVPVHYLFMKKVYCGGSNCNIFINQTLNKAWHPLGNFLETSKELLMNLIMTMKFKMLLQLSCLLSGCQD